MSDSDEFMVEMIEIYRSQIPVFMTMFKTHIDNANFVALRDTAHKLKGAMAVLGITCLNETIDYLENNEHIVLSEFEDFVQKYRFTCTEVDIELNVVLQELNK
jgi:HPt (histidine-containing phosphotransfer) domain-containing protein